MANPKCQTQPTFDTFSARSADSTGLFSMPITRAASFDHLVDNGISNKMGNSLSHDLRFRRDASRYAGLTHFYCAFGMAFLRR